MGFILISPLLCNTIMYFYVFLCTFMDFLETCIPNCVFTEMTFLESFGSAPPQTDVFAISPATGYKFPAPPETLPSPDEGARML